MSSLMPPWTVAAATMSCCRAAVSLAASAVVDGGWRVFRWPELRVAAWWRSAGGSSLVVWTVESSTTALPFGGG
ncbi:hypothetical protein Dimus_020504, partial [Dionaea muscipula]